MGGPNIAIRRFRCKDEREGPNPTRSPGGTGLEERMGRGGSGQGAHGAWDAYAAAAVTGVMTGMMRISRADIGPQSPLAWAGVILYAGTLALVWLSTSDHRLRRRRLLVCAAVTCLGMLAGAAVTALTG